MGPDFADQARHAFEREPCEHCDEANSFTCCAGYCERPNNRSLYWVTAAIVSAALILALGMWLR